MSTLSHTHEGRTARTQPGSLTYRPFATLSLYPPSHGKARVSKFTPSQTYFLNRTFPFFFFFLFFQFNSQPMAYCRHVTCDSRRNRRHPPACISEKTEAQGSTHRRKRLFTRHLDRKRKYPHYQTVTPKLPTVQYDR